MNVQTHLNELRTIEQDGVLYVSTLSVYKYIGYSSHARLKEKAARMNLPIEDLEIGSAMAITDLAILLKEYAEQLTNGTKKRVTALLENLNEPYVPFNDVPKAVDTSERTRLPSDELINTVQTNKQERSPINETVNAVQTNKHTTSTKMNGVQKAVNAVQENRTPSEHLYSSIKGQLRWYERCLNELNRIIKALTAFLKTESFVFIVLTGALLIQVSHVAILFVQVAETKNKWILVGGYLFGGVAELTALILTIHKGSKNTLRIYSLLTFWLNILYYKVWLGFDGTMLWYTNVLIKITLSAFLAFVIYSYGELFTKTAFKA